MDSQRGAGHLHQGRRIWHSAGKQHSGPEGRQCRFNGVYSNRTRRDRRTDEQRAIEFREFKKPWRNSACGQPQWNSIWKWRSFASQVQNCKDELMSLEGLSILGHSRVKPAGKAVPAINPANGSELPIPFYWATSEDVSRAAELASKAFAEYRRWPASRRAKLLQLIASLIEADASALVERANLETALPPARLQGEIGRTCGQLRLFATLIEE